MGKNGKTVAVDHGELKKWAVGTGKTLSELSRQLGRGDAYLSNLITHEKLMSDISYKFLLSQFNLPDGSFIPKPKKVEPPKPAPTVIPDASAEQGWQTRIKVTPDRLEMTVYFNGLEEITGYSYIKGNREIDLFQAISYASHMCYKLAEQRMLKAGGKRK